ncbi:MAG: iron ABC transporter permease, partial [Kiritimatiellae bacterium]|nr:iron ABC transporter permease [Kiritimatiellia bacterium]
MSASHMRRSVWTLAFFLFVFVSVLALMPWIGAERLAWSEIIAYVRDGQRTAHGLILFHQRIPRILLALMVGGALSMAGATLQVLFRNPLAEPWTLGVAGGAAIGAFLPQVFPPLANSWGSLNATPFLALLGAGGAMAIVWSFARRAGSMTTHALLLAGVTLSIVSGGVVMLLVYFISPFEVASFHRWMMGGLDVIGYKELLSVLVLGLPGMLLLASQAREYNHLAFSEEMALGHGVDVARVKRLTFLGAGLTTAACVAVAGPIGFVGMIVPHIVRRLAGFDYRFVLPCSFLLGGAVLVLCDGIARTVIAPTEIPVGIITAVIGGPAFLFL